MSKEIQDYAFKNLSVVADCNQEYGNLVALLSSVLEDFKALYEISGKSYKWHNLLQNTLTTLNLNDETIERFRHELMSFTKFEVKKLIVAPSLKLQADRIKYLYAVRALIILWHLNNSKKIPSSLLDQLDTIFKAKKSEDEIIVQNLCIDVHQLVKFQESFTPTHKWFKFLSAVIIALQSLENEPSSNTLIPVEISTARQQEIEKSNAKSLDKVQEQDMSKEDRPYKSILDSGDLFRYNLSQLDFLYRKEFSGIPNLYSNYHPDELMQFMPKVAREYMENDDDVRFAFFLCIFLRCHVSRFNLIPLEQNAGSQIWLDLSNGFIVWNRQALIKKPDENIPETIPKPLVIEPVKIPMPIEIVKGLEKKYRKFPDAKTLGNLFDGELPNLKKMVRKFTFTNSNSSHRPYLTRLHYSYGRFVLHLCRDEVYAAAISVDFSLGVTANFNYVVLEPRRINEICAETYKKLGFSGEVLVPVDSPVGSAKGQKIEKIISILNAELENAREGFLEINNRSDLKDLMVVHNQIVFSLSLLLAVTCGLRKAHHYSICNHTVDIENKLMLVHDKASTEYLTCRLVPIPYIADKWLRFYKNWLKSLTSRLSGRSKKMSADIASISADACSFGSIPLLFCFHRGQIKTVGSKHFLPMIKNDLLEGDLGRHFLDRVLRDRLGSALLNAHAGRANLGQETFGVRSALSAHHALAELLKVIDSELEKFKIILPPTKEPVRYALVTPKAIYSPQIWQNPAKKKVQKDLGEACPYGEFCLFNSSKFEKLIDYWVTSPLKKSVGQVAVSLILMDGLVHPEEILYAVKELIYGRIIKIEDEYFVDVNTPLLGIRRINLSAITLCVINTVTPLIDSIFENELQNQMELTVSVLLKEVGINENNSLKYLMKMAEDYYSIRVPGPVREWMCGRQHARTLRPEALVRHESKLKERISNLGTGMHQSRKIRSNQIIIDLINEACDKNNNTGSNELRLARLAAAMGEVVGSFISLADTVMARYAWFLSSSCPKVKSPNTVHTHFYRIKTLVQNICMDFDDMDELEYIDWLDVSTNFLLNNKEAQNISSLNYLLRLFKQPEFQSLKKDDARASRSYADYPSTIEVNRAIHLITENAHLSEYQKLAALMLSLMAHVPLRAEDIAYLRTSDLFIGDTSYLVLTSAATGTRKSDSANRVLFLSAPQLINQLDALQKIRISLSQGKGSKTSLFGNSKVLESFDGIEELLFIISDALRCATGSIYARPHSLRAKNLTECISEALMPHIKPLDALKQRNLIYEFSVSAGHADPDVTIKNYMCEFNLIRRSWVDVLVHDKLKLHATFLSTITSLSYDAARKRLQRNFSIGELNKTFYLEINSDLGMRTHDQLKSEILHEFEYELSSRSNQVDNPIQSAQLLACFILGMTRDIAASYINVSDVIAQKVELNLTVFNAYKSEDFFTKLRVDYAHFKVGNAFINFSQHFGFCKIDSIQSAKLLKLIPVQIEKPWLCSIADIPFILDLISPKMLSAGYILKVLIPKKNSEADFEKKLSLNRLGVRRVESTSRRYFDSKNQLMILFTKSNETTPSCSTQKINNFEINIFMLSFLMKREIQG